MAPAFDAPTEPAAPTTGFVPWPRARRREADGGPVQAARSAFWASVADLPLPVVQALHRRIERVGSLAELWHLRPEVFRLVAVHHSQGEAERRLAALDRHF
jgi:hypothetical protein